MKKSLLDPIYKGNIIHPERNFTKSLKADRRQYEQRGYTYLFSDGQRMHFMQTAPK